MSRGSEIYCQQGKKSLFGTKFSPNQQPRPIVLSAETSVMRDIDHISVSVGPPVTRDYRIDRNSTVQVVVKVYSGEVPLGKRPYPY